MDPPTPLPKKRAGIDPANIIEGPRLKRRKESPEPATSKPAKQRKTSHPVERPVKEEETDVGTEERVKAAEEGSKIWHAVREAKDASGRLLCHDFLRLPSKRVYPDYYTIIKRPLSLEDVKASLDSLSYSNLEAIRQDFLTIFRNAQRYNLRESQIWEDAKALRKIIGKEFKAMNHQSQDDADEDDHQAEGQAHNREDAREDAVVDVEEDGGQNPETSEKVKKKKPLTMQRALKQKLQRLMKKTDDSGRERAGPFMELPDKKEWAIYYQLIEHPICLSDILGKVNRNEYKTIAECQADVDLLFNNALTFNEDKSEIAEDARILKESFHESLKKLPPTFADTELTSDDKTKHDSSSTKIKIKFQSGKTGAQGANAAEGGRAGNVQAPQPSQSPALSMLSPILPATSAPIPERQASEARSPHSRSQSQARQAPATVASSSRHHTLPGVTYYPNTGQGYDVTQAPAYGVSPHGSQAAYSPAVRAASLTSDRPATPNPIPPPRSPSPPEDPSTRAIKNIELLIHPSERRVLLEDDLAKAFSLILGNEDRGLQASVNLNEFETDVDMPDADTDPEEVAADVVGEKPATTKGSSEKSDARYDFELRLNGVRLAQVPNTELSSDDSSSSLDSSTPLVWSTDFLAGLNLIEVVATPKAGVGKNQIWKVFINKVM